MLFKLEFAFSFEAIRQKIEDAFVFFGGTSQQTFDWVDDVDFEFIWNVSQILNYNFL